MREGAAMERAGRAKEAVSIYAAIVSQFPQCAGAMARLAFFAQREGRLEESERWMRRAVEVSPASAEHLGNLAMVLGLAGRLEESAQTYERALGIRPDAPGLWVNLAVTFARLKNWERAENAYHAALKIDPSLAEVHFRLGSLYRDMGRTRDAIEAHSRAIELQPDFAQAYVGLGSALRDEERLDEALVAFNKALSIRPQMGEVHGAVAAIYHLTGQATEATRHYRRAAELMGRPEGASFALVTLHLDPASDPKSLYEEHVAWNLRFARPLAAEIVPHVNDRSPDRRLRIGFVSAYFTGEPVGRFVSPLIEQRDREKFEIACYSDAQSGDETTQSLRRGADLWRDSGGLSDQQLAAQVRADRIDILIDLGMHTRANRMLAFARKPAPVQVTHLAYCGTTGLETIDYRISDPYLDPTDADQPYYSEKTVRLSSYWCYSAPAAAPQVSPPPVVSRGYVTFGCLNEAGKVNDNSLAMWRRNLKLTPGSRLVLHSHLGSHRQRVLDFFAAEGVDASRIEFVRRQSIENYFATYSCIDIALDPAPWCGGTTTCDALWMGVPVVTLSGRTAISRGGVSILGQLGMGSWVAHDPEEYVTIATSLARDTNRLEICRRELRDRMRSSRLMDAVSFTREFEERLREMWKIWCARAH
jgi:predicted O-linked N-acetylglucosamine transferase (SPINDLY family)